MAPEIILASASPRRRQLLAGLGLQFSVQPSPFDEGSVSEADPGRLVEALARGKAQAVAAAQPQALVIGADTVVVLEGEILGKPAGPEDARAMLARLSGRSHQVYTGVALVHRATARADCGHEVTDVRFAELPAAVIARYVATGEPLDKAGAYGIQGLGATLVAAVNGCYFNVVGLPLHRLSRMLAAFGVVIP